MAAYVSNMKFSAVLILILNNLGAFSQFVHELSYLVGCFGNGTTQANYAFDGEEFLYVDFENEALVYTVPPYIALNPSKIFDESRTYINAQKNKKLCPAVVNLYVKEEKNPPEHKEPPQTMLYPANEVELGTENQLICFVNHFYPPDIRVSWTKNDHPVSEGVMLSRYFPNNDITFHQFSTLTFTPREGDAYSCTVEHIALETPIKRIWDGEFTNDKSLGPDVFCGVGLSSGLLGVAIGTFLFVKGQG
ncbi:H-2 class II histocompatibility antigen, A-U alpha chain-like isoform 2-T3 [Pholidichthys leucotaenia]